MVKYRIRPYWYTERVSDMAKNPMAVEQWIKGLMTTPRKKDKKPRPLAPKSKGHPYHADTMRQRHLNKAAAKIGLPKLGWHAFRHTYRARLSELGLPLEVQQKLMRHASIDMTTRYGRNSMLNVTRPANAQIVEMIMPKADEKSEKGTGSAPCSPIVPSPFSANLVSC